MTIKRNFVIVGRIFPRKIYFYLLSLLLLSSDIQGEEQPAVLKLDFSKYTAPGTVIKGGTIQSVPPETSILTDPLSKRKYLSFNGRGDTLVIKPLDVAVKSTLKGSFTLEFDFFTDKLLLDKYYTATTPKKVEVFNALSASGKKVLRVYLNQYNRITVMFRNNLGANTQIISNWNNKKNHEITGILRGKWYHVAVVHDQKNESLELYLDNQYAGKTKIPGELVEVDTFRFGGVTSKNIREIFSGGIRAIALAPGVLYNDKISNEATESAWQRLHDSARKKYAEYLLPENPQWAQNHPRMLITPSRIETLKTALKQGKGPELMSRLIRDCDAMIDPDSPAYLKGVVTGHNIKGIMKPAVLCLASLLTGDKKYAEYAGKVVTEFTEKIGYNDMTHQLVMSAGHAKPIMNVALTYDWGYQYLTEKQRRTIRLYLLEIAKGTYDFYHGVEWSTPKSDSLCGWVANWTALSISTLGNSSLAILGETSGNALTWLDFAKFRAVRYGLFGIGMDGCFHELPGYMAFGAGPIIVFMEALATAGGDDLLKATNFRKFPEFLPYAFQPANDKLMPLKYSSEYCGLHRTDSYIMALLRKKFGTTACEWDWQNLYHGKTWPDDWSLFSIIWFEPEKRKLSSPSLPLAKWFKSEGVAAFRSDWSKDAVAGIFMAYPAKIVAHDQCDRGQFNFYGYQGRWIIDTGGRGQPEYSHRDAHNLVTVDNREPRFKPQVGTNHHHDAFLTNFCHMDNLITAVEADLTNSYRYRYNWQFNHILHFYFQ